MLNSFNKLDTRQLAYARHEVGKQFCSHILQRLDSSDHFRVRQNLYEGKILSLSYLSYGAKVDIEPGELENFYLLQIPLSAEADITNGGQSFTSDCKTAVSSTFWSASKQFRESIQTTKEWYRCGRRQG